MKVTEFTSNLTNINVSHRKENHYSRSMYLVSFDTVTNEFKEVIKVDFFATQARTYAVVWIHQTHHNGVHNSGSACVSGYGYHRPSAALQQALHSAGIRLDEDIHGRGDSVMKEALEAIGKYLEIEHFTVINT